MPAFDYLTHQQRFALSHFVLSLAPGHPADTEVRLAALDKEFSLSVGAKEPNVIPVATAMAKTVTDGVAAAALQEAQIDDAAGQAVFDKVVEPGARDRLVKLLGSNPSWRDDPTRLKTLASVDPVAAGFRPRVRLLAEAEWQAMHVYLKNRYQAATP